MSEQNGYKYLGPRQGSNYRQWFLKGTRTRACWIYSAVARSDEPYTPEQAAVNFNIPVEAVHECVDYCIKNKALLDEEAARELADIRARGLDKPPYVPLDYQGES